LAKQWRLVKSAPLQGDYNMAIDEALLFSTSQKTVLPTLRIYSWKVPTISLGYAQKSSEVDLEALQAYGWDLVRRPTGGRAILHTDELTYSITAPNNDPVVAGSLLESYQRISIALLHTLALLGVNARADSQYIEPPKLDAIQSVCFEVPSNYEITVSGKKLIGSAQARKANGVLQHGSLPLFGDLARITQALKYDSIEERESTAQRLLTHAGTLETFSGRIFSMGDIQNAFIEAFTETLDLEFIPSNPSDGELEMASQLVRTKYGSNDWTFRI
jgi:lipoate-protein ligase A